MELLTQLIAVNPDPPLTALLRQTCAATMSLPALPASGDPLEDHDVTVFAEQFSADVSAVSPELRKRFMKMFGAKAFHVAALTYIADFVPRVRAGFAALGLPGFADPLEWDRDTDPVDLLLNRFAGTVGAMRELDPVTTEVVRLRGAAAHNCRLCKSLREGAALDAGGNESMYSEIELYESSALLSARHKAALRYVDALVWTPSQIDTAVAAGVREHYSDAEATEITLDVMRNGINKIAVALGGDAPRVSEGTERYLLGADGQPVYS